MNNYFSLFEDEEDEIHYIPSDVETSSDNENENENENENDTTIKSEYIGIETLYEEHELKKLYDALKMGFSWFDIIYPRDYSRSYTIKNTIYDEPEDRSVSSTDTWVMVDKTNQATGKRRKNPHKKQTEIQIRKPSPSSEPLKKKAKVY
jgi:hypothetical protein